MKEETLKELFEKEKDDCCFFETGTSGGKGVQRAINVGFKDIRSIELSTALYEEAVSRFTDQSHVKLYQGSSKTLLHEFSKDIQTDIFFWLDAHYSFGRTAIDGNQICPLMEELEQIKNLSLNTHTICIDDVADIYNGYMQVDMDEIKQKLLEINPNYELSFVPGFDTDILMASVR